MMTREDCPAFGKRCNSCGKDNHFASVCEQRKSRASFACTDDDTSPEETSADESDRHESDAEEEPAFHFAANSPHFRIARTRNRKT